MIFNSLTKDDVLLYKGWAILLIVIHNFMHLFPLPKEMEFYFVDDRFFIFIDFLARQPLEVIRGFFSYLGHFGVQIFVFLSAYGLSKRYQKDKLVFKPYILKRLLTIYPQFLLAIVLFVALTIVKSGDLIYGMKIIYWNLDSYLYKLFLLSNFIKNEPLSLVGPWWFISFIFQFYLLFPWLLKGYQSLGSAFLLAISLAAISVCFFTGGFVGHVNLYYTVVAHLPELCLGVYLARHDGSGVKVPRALFLVVVGIFVLGNYWLPAWYLSHFSALFLMLCVASSLKITSRSLARLLMFFGSVSMPLFLVNGFLREPFLSYAIDANLWYVTLGLCLVFLFVSVITALFLQRCEGKALQYFGIYTKG